MNVSDAHVPDLRADSYRIVLHRYTYERAGVRGIAREVHPEHGDERSAGPPVSAPTLDAALRLVATQAAEMEGRARGGEAAQPAPAEVETRLADCPSLHGVMMNLRCEVPQRAWGGYIPAYKLGHRDARHAAAEAALEFDERLRVALAGVEVVRAERDKARAIVAKLPKLADGVPVLPGMMIWRRALTNPPVAFPGDVMGFEKPHEDEPWWVSCKQWSSPLCDCYSTRAAALAAPAEPAGTEGTEKPSPEPPAAPERASHAEGEPS